MKVINQKILQKIESSTINSKVRDSYKEFPKRLRERRKALGLTPQDVGYLADIGAPSLSSYENGRSFPGFDRVVALATLLNCSTDWLLGLSDNVNAGPVGLLPDEYAPDVGSVSINIHTENPKMAVSINIGGETILCLAEKLIADPGTHFTVEHFGGAET